MMDATMVYRYFYDCEFIEDGRVIDLVSIGVVDENGREFYAISTAFDDRAAVPWVRRNVLDRLPSPGDPAWRSRARIRDELLEFLVEPLRDQPGGRAGAEKLELWAWYAAYDHVALAQLWGPMPTLPREIPRFTKDLRQLWDDKGRPPLPDAAQQRHDALVDARHNLARWHVLSNGATSS
jgi:3'-5' exoribonuclease Rv2179c-like domain